LVQRRAGSGTYITDGAGTKAGFLFGLLIPSLIELNYQIPKEVRIVGIDDVQYASLLPVPLTTVRQPCREIGLAAVATMLERIASPDMPARDILLNCKLVVRTSCVALAAAVESVSRDPGAPTHS
jgi:hypothetical protein